MMKPRNHGEEQWYVTKHTNQPRSYTIEVETRLVKNKQFY